ncbi:MAG: sigma factor-like helix-turn-helix DNA-binding protein [Phycisphaerales bacterium]
MIELRHIGGMSFRQMAEHLDEPLGTLLARHHRALRKLREGLGPGIEEEVEDLG